MKPQFHLRERALYILSAKYDTVLLTEEYARACCLLP